MSEKGPNPKKVAQADQKAVKVALGLENSEAVVDPVSPEGPHPRKKKTREKRKQARAAQADLQRRKQEVEIDKKNQQKNQGTYVYRQGDEFIFPTKTEISDKSPKKTIKEEILDIEERTKQMREQIDILKETRATPEQKELDKYKSDLLAKTVQIKETIKNKSNKFAKFAQILGIKTRNLDDDEEIRALGKEKDSIYENLIKKGYSLYKDDKAKLEDFIREYGNKKELEIELTNKALDIQAKNAGLPEKALNSFYKIGKRWSEMKWWQKTLIMGSAGLLTGGGALAVGYGTLGAFALTAGTRYGMRGFGAMAAGIGKKVLLEKEEKRERDEKWKEIFDRQMQFLKENENDLDAGIALSINQESFSDIRKNFEAKSFENTRKALKFFGKTLAYSTALGETIRVVGQETGINFGTILKKLGGYVGVGGGAHSAVENIQKSSSIAQMGIDESHRPESASAGRLTEDNLKIAEQAKTEELVGIVDKPQGQSVLSEPETKLGEGSKTFSESDVKAGRIIEETKESSMADAEAQAPEVEKPQSVLVGENNVKSGGGIERSAKAIIKANPKEFGLDPNDPKLNAKAGQKAHLLARGLAEKFGMTYKELNEIASSKVQVGDEIRIYKDPVTGKLNLTYNGAAFDEALSPNKALPIDVSEAKVSQNVPADEIGKPKVASDNLKPKTGATELSPQKGRVKIAGMEEIEANYKKDLADRNYARAVQAEQDWQVRRERMAALGEKNFELANIQQSMAIRGYLEHHILPHTAIGKNISFWEGSALQWYEDVQNKQDLIAADVSQADATELHNQNMRILKELFAKLGKPKVDQTNWEYLLEKTRDSQTAYLINKIIMKK